MESRIPVWRSGDGTAFGSYNAGKIPNIQGAFAAGSEWCWVSLIAGSEVGPFTAGSSFNLTVIKGGGAVQSGTKIGFDASRCSVVYTNNADRVMMASIKMNWVVKYI